MKPVLAAGLESACALLEPVTGYVLAARPLHENLRLALLQLSGFLLQRLLARPTAVADFRSVEAARDVIAGAEADLAALSAPNGARHHRYHLDRALSALPTGLALNTVDTGPFILAFSPHSVVAAPYHRNVDGIMANLESFGGSDEAARAIALSRGAAYVIACVDDSGVMAYANAIPDGFAAWQRICDVRTERRGGRTRVAVYLDSGKIMRLHAPYDGRWLASDREIERKLFMLRNLWETHRSFTLRPDRPADAG